MNPREEWEKKKQAERELLEQFVDRDAPLTVISSKSQMIQTIQRHGDVSPIDGGFDIRFLAGTPVKDAAEAAFYLHILSKQEVHFSFNGTAWFIGAGPKQ